MQSLSNIPPSLNSLSVTGWIDHVQISTGWLCLLQITNDFLWLSKVAPGIAIVDYLHSVTLAHHSKPLQFFFLAVCFQVRNHCDLIYSWPPDVVPILNHRSHCRFSLLCHGHHLLENLWAVIEELNIDLSGLHGSITGLIPLLKYDPFSLLSSFLTLNFQTCKSCSSNSFPRYCCTELY